MQRSLFKGMTDGGKSSPEPLRPIVFDPERGTHGVGTMSTGFPTC